MFKVFSIFKWIVALIISILAIYGGFHVFSKFSGLSNNSAFYEENLTDKFQAYATKVTGKQSLYVAKLEQKEIIERKSEASVLGFDLPSVVLKVEVPVEYNYYVNLTNGWSFKFSDNVLTVSVPELTNSKPAIDISKLRFILKKGSVFRSEKEVAQRFQKELPSLLIDRSIGNRDLVRDQAKVSIQEFVHLWVKDKFKPEQEITIRVLFPNEENIEQKIPAHK